MYTNTGYKPYNISHQNISPSSSEDQLEKDLKSFEQKCIEFHAHRASLNPEIGYSLEGRISELEVENAILKREQQTTIENYEYIRADMAVAQAEQENEILALKKKMAELEKVNARMVELVRKIDEECRDPISTEDFSTGARIAPNGVTYGTASIEWIEKRGTNPKNVQEALKVEALYPNRLAQNVAALLKKNSDLFEEEPK
ncbi:MAG: hypothetical protein LW832_07805 [Parachlamydia sp.]|jgi:hypothetical protein|nr:hypothetical protein [Parachlamydia sp.]